MKALLESVELRRPWAVPARAEFLFECLVHARIGAVCAVAVLWVMAVLAVCAVAVLWLVTVLLLIVCAPVLLTEALTRAVFAWAKFFFEKVVHTQTVAVGLMFGLSLVLLGLWELFVARAKFLFE